MTVSVLHSALEAARSIPFGVDVGGSQQRCEFDDVSKPELGQRIAAVHFNGPHAQPEAMRGDLVWHAFRQDCCDFAFAFRQLVKQLSCLITRLPDSRLMM